MRLTSGLLRAPGPTNRLSWGRVASGAQADRPREQRPPPSPCPCPVEREHHFRCAARAAWNPADASAELRSNPAWIQTQLEQLAERGLLLREGAAFRFGARPELDQAVDDLAHAYRTFPVTVVGAIYPTQGQPNQGLRHFADAFRLRRPAQSPPPPPESKEGPRG
jgi:hypothetical protein